MKNEAPTVLDRGSEKHDLILELPLPPAPRAEEAEAFTSAPEPHRRLGLLLHLFAFLARRLRRRRTRLALLELTEDQLKDIGLSRSETYGGYSRYRRGASHALERKIP
ncbi:DUF1127 domain-containing protein [Rhizobium sp. LC145]|uniref:DUF1127 domain-containing protein n=1 Tax=Rhizobium sp. LC145 TaxID=1120688 RepID=UPI00062A1B25|nr:DUF1127 domain-containing protein [Rhizobium sp. LC145]KKX30343.1 hypothetical protein YH62_12405 [Rhizobium sp. LC145]TKT56780.1 DUF1127 domain-containing protein [Rhizobiaceae bacterium LC148]